MEAKYSVMPFKEDPKTKNVCVCFSYLLYAHFWGHNIILSI